VAAGGGVAMTGETLALLRDTYCQEPPVAVRPFVDYFTARFGEALTAVVFYGSKLDPTLADETSFFDFYLICEDYAATLTRRRDRLLARFLPPNIYYLELPGAGPGRAAKYCVISLDDLRAAVGDDAKDFYHLGRFSKRLAVVWWRDTYERDAVLECCRQAIRVVAEHAVNRVPNEFTLDEFIGRALALSYEGEVRLEKTDEKVEALFASAAPFYREVFGIALEQYRRDNGDLFHDPQPDDPPGVYFMRRSVSQRAALHEDTRLLLNRSRRRARARWPKAIVLVDNWLNILLAKVERTYGVRIELTPTERRWPLILGWRHYFRLRREGKIR